VLVDGCYLRFPRISAWVSVILVWQSYPFLADSDAAERPIRHFESVSEVINSWDKDKSVNLLVAKKTPLATLLHPSVWAHFLYLTNDILIYTSSKGHAIQLPCIQYLC
jgi:hypothetical protein